MVFGSPDGENRYKAATNHLLASAAKEGVSDAGLAVGRHYHQINILLANSMENFPDGCSMSQYGSRADVGRQFIVHPLVQELL